MSIPRFVDAPPPGSSSRHQRFGSACAAASLLLLGWACSHAPEGGATTTGAGIGGGTAAAGGAPTGTSAGGSAGTGGAGGAAGGSPAGSSLVDTGLIVRYYIDEAASGQGPAELVDAAPAPQPLGMVWGPELSYAEDGAGHRGLRWNQIEQYSRATVAVDGTKISGQLHGSTTGTIETVVSVSAVSTSHSRLSHIGQDEEGGRFTLSMPSPSRLQFYTASGRKGYWEVDFPGLGRIVLHLVLDTTLADPAERVKLYLDGALVPSVGGEPPDQDEVLDLGTGRHYVLGNREVGERTFVGTLYYAAMYGSALSAADVLNNVGVLISDDDTPDDTPAR